MPDNDDNNTARLIDTRGQVAFGLFPGSVSDINGREADYRTPMGRPAGRLARHFHYKQFQYFGVISDDLLAGCAQPSMAPSINAAAARVLDALGISMVEAAGAGCCGAVRFHLDDQDGARDRRL